MLAAAGSVAALLATDCGRLHSCIGGRKKEDAKMKDGLRQEKDKVAVSREAGS